MEVLLLMPPGIVVGPGFLIGSAVHSPPPPPVAPRDLKLPRPCDDGSSHSLPGLVFFPKGSAEPVVYEGAMTADDIAEHLVDLVGEVS